MLGAEICSQDFIMQMIKNLLLFLSSKYKILPSFSIYDNIKKEVICMEKERKAITIRVSPELKFQIEKAANEDNRTINSWIVNVIKQHLESVKK